MGLQRPNSQTDRYQGSSEVWYQGAPTGSTSRRPQGGQDTGRVVRKEAERDVEEDQERRGCQGGQGNHQRRDERVEVVDVVGSAGMC